MLNFRGVTAKAPQNLTAKRPLKPLKNGWDWKMFLYSAFSF